MATGSFRTRLVLRSVAFATGAVLTSLGCARDQRDLVLLMTIRLLVQSPVPDPDVALDAATRVAVIEGALKALNDVYVFPAVAAKMVQAVRDRQQRHEYDSISRLASSRTFSAAEDFTYA